MQATRSYSSYSSQTQVQDPSTRDVKRSRDDACPNLAEVVTSPDMGVKKAKNRAVVQLQPNKHKPKKAETAPPSQGTKRERTVDEDTSSNDDIGDVIKKMEKVSLQTSEVVTQIGPSNGTFTFFKKSIALEIDPQASLDMSDEEFIHLTSRYQHFTHLSVLQSKTISDTGFIKALMGRTNMLSVSIGYCPYVTDWTLHALAEQCPNLCQLSLTKCSQITDDGIDSITSKCKNLRKLNVEWCFNLSDKTLLALGQNSPELQEFTTAQCGEYTLKGFHALVTGCTRLEKLELWNCTQVDDSWIEALCKSKCPIKELDITGCDNISDNAIKSLEERFSSIAITR